MEFIKFIVGKIGPPIFTATFLAALMAKTFGLVHIIFLSAGVLIIYIEHHFVHSEQGYNFPRTLLGKLGPPMFAATLIACLLGERYELIHTFFVLLGLFCIYLDYIFKKKPVL